jgi:hypothetical protein
MTCGELEDRLFDEDCRSALLGQGDVPGDVAEHLGRCPACAREWSRAAAETSLLSQALVVVPPPALRGRMLRAYRPAGRGASAGRAIGVETLFGTIAFGALGAGLAGGVPGVSEWVGFAVGASFGLAGEAVRRANPSWRAPLTALGRVLRQCLASLVPVV